MKNVLLKITSKAIWAFSLFGLAALAQAAPSFDFNGQYGNCPPPCCQQEECCHVAPACGEAYNPAAYFVCNNCQVTNSFWDNLRYRSDFLWWRGCEEGLALGTEEITSAYPDGEMFEKSRLKEPDFHYDPGFRIGLSSICSCDCWDVALNWTYFHTKASVRGESTPGLRVINRGVQSFLDGQSNNADIVFVSEWERDPNLYVPDLTKGKWTLNLDWLDLEFGRKFYVANCFIVRPFFGLRGARVDQGFRTSAFSVLGANGGRSFTSQVKAKSNFLGIGPRIGFDAELRLPCCLTLFGELGGSLVFGRTQRHSDEHIEASYETLEVIGNNTSKTHSTLDRCTHAITDLQIGLKWEHCCTWCNRQHPITLAVSWEFHNLYGFNRFILDQNLSTDSRPYLAKFGDQIKGSSKSGNLSTQGLTVSAEVGF